MKYRKKPIVVEAVQYLDPFIEYTPCLAYVITAHGQRVYLVYGDWIVTEPDGRGHYPVKPDIFAATYEPVEE